MIGEFGGATKYFGDGLKGLRGGNSPKDIKFALVG